MNHIFKLAWQESRRSRGRLLLLMFSISLGVAVLVSITSFAENLRKSIDVHAKTLLGADLAIKSLQRPSEEAERFVAALPGEKSRETNFSSMASFLKTDTTRLVQIRAVDASFPFYGELVTQPPNAASQLMKGAFAVVDESLLLQVGAEVGDTIKLGTMEFRIAGALEQVPGGSPIGEIIAPRIFIGANQTDATGLLQLGSRASYRIYFRLDDKEVARIVNDRATELDRYGFIPQTAQDRKRTVGEQIENIYRFLRLSSFFALFLGGIGVFTAATVFAREKVQTAAVLRALGMRSRAAALMFSTQVVAAAFVASAFGAIAGIGFQFLLPYAFRDLLPVQVALDVSVRAIFEGIGVGLAVSLCSTWSILSILRNASAAAVFRGDSSDTPARDRWRLIQVTAVLLLAFGLIALEAENLRQAAMIFGGALVICGSLALVARLLIMLSRKLARRFLPFSLRQGCLNISRPNNQTAAVTLTAGFTVLLACTLWIAKLALVEQVRVSAGPSRPNLVLFDIQPDQLPEIEAFVTKHSAPILEVVPIVMMRLAGVDNKPVNEILRDPANKIPQWTLQREYRSTYRSALDDSEKLLKGELVPKVSASSGLIPVSLEKGIAEKLHAGIGSELTFDVQGISVQTVVRSIREVDWQRVHPNFFVVFPEGVLEDAPQLRLLTTRTENIQDSASLQRDAVREFPGVSVIDLTLILKIVDQVLMRLTRVVEVVTLAVCLVALAVLLNSMRSSMLTRARERALLKVLGAKPLQLVLMSGTEYALLGLVSGLSGALLSVGVAYLLFTFWFETPYSVPLRPLFILPLVTAFIVVLSGLLGGVRNYGRSALEVLRSE